MDKEKIYTCIETIEKLSLDNDHLSRHVEDLKFEIDRLKLYM